MKPSQTTNQLSSTKLTTFTPTSNIYEPTSVLDSSLNSSPSSDHHIDNHHVLPISDPLDEYWQQEEYPLSFFLLDQDSANTNTSNNIPDPSLQFPDLDSIFSSPPVFDQTHLDQLIRAAQAVESNDRSLACTILARLSHHLIIPGSPPLHRAAGYFKDALQSILLDENSHDPFGLPLSSLDLVRKIAAYKTLSELSPVAQFCSFTANQAILDAIDVYGFSRPIHIIDFDIGLGGQWSSFMHEIATRCRAYRIVPPSVLITAVLTEESLETSLMADNLREFAAGVGIHFDVDFVHVGGMGPGVLGNVRLAAGEFIAVSFTPSVVGIFSGGGADTVAGFLRFVRRVAPRVVVFVDAESCCSETVPDRSFRRSFVNGLEYYSVVLESLDAAAAAVGFGEEQVGRIERALVRPRVWNAVRSWGARAMPWREMMDRAGFKPVPFSEFTESQAEWLATRAPIGGYDVARRDGLIMLSWQGREMSATSAWRC